MMKQWFVSITTALILFVCSGYAQDSSSTIKPEEPELSGFRWLAVPGYAPETSLSLTGGGLYFWRRTNDNATNRLNQIFGGVQVTLRKQFILSFYPDVYFNNENIRLYGQAEVSRYPDYFYGVGTTTALTEETREPFTIFRTALIGSLLFSVNGKGIRNGVNIGVRFDFDYQNMVERKVGGLLESGTILGSDGGLIAGVGLAINYDSRDVAIAATQGGFVEFRAVPYLKALGGKYDFTRFTLDARTYWSVAGDSSYPHVLALHWYNELSTGDVPFFRMGLLGTSIGGTAVMRGIFNGRFRDKMMSAAQAEYRLPIGGRWGAVAFVGAGNVSSSLDAFQFEHIKIALGAGLRFALVPDEHINIRFDIGYGVSTKTLFPYISFTEAF